MKRILIINTLYSPYIGGGAEIICQEQAEGLAARGYHVAIMTTTTKNGVNEDTVGGLKVYRVHLENVYWHYKNKPERFKRALWHIRDIYNSKMIKNVHDVIEKEKPDVVICHNITGFSISIWDVIKKAKLPIIQVLHDQYLQCPNSNAYKGNRQCERQCWSCKIMRIPHKKKSQQVDVVVGVSNYVLNRLLSLGYFKGCRHEVIHNARSFEDVPIKSLWNVKRPLRIGYIGTLSPVKGVEWLIRTFINLDINATLKISGNAISNEYGEYLREIAKTDDRIIFSGYVDSLSHYRDIDLSVIPSLWPDTFPTVAFESCANNVPVIATKIGGLPEIIYNDVNGIVIEVDNKNALKSAIMKIYNNPNLLEKLTLSARDSVKEMCDKENMINKYCDIIESL